MHGITVLRFVSLQFALVKRVESSDEMPNGNFFRTGQNKKIGRMLPREINLGILGRLKKGRKVQVAMFFTVAPVGRAVVGDPIGVVQSQVVGRGANQSGKPGNGFESRPLSPIVGVENPGQPFEQKRVPNLKSMTTGAIVRPFAGELCAKIKQGVEALSIGNCRRPNPLNAQRSLAPTNRFVSIPVAHEQADPGASNRSKHFGSEFQRHPCFDRNELQVGGKNADVEI